jgi:hypothetical protein
VITLAALAPASCQKEHATRNPPPPEHTKTSGKRAVRTPLPAAQQFKGHIDWAAARRLNPRHAEDGTIFAGQSGDCYVLVQKDPGGPIGPPGTGLEAKNVDCPDLMQDPAWDTCLGGEIVKTSSGECACARSGNPPPPNTQAECPKSAP